MNVKIVYSDISPDLSLLITINGKDYIVKISLDK